MNGHLEGVPQLKIWDLQLPWFFTTYDSSWDDPPSKEANNSRKRPWLVELNMYNVRGTSSLKLTAKAPFGCYCWWTKSCTTKDDDYPIIYRFLTIPGGPGFLPSTVCSTSASYPPTPLVFLFNSIGVGCHLFTGWWEEKTRCFFQKQICRAIFSFCSKTSSVRNFYLYLFFFGNSNQLTSQFR